MFTTLLTPNHHASSIKHPASQIRLQRTVRYSSMTLSPSADTGLLRRHVAGDLLRIKAVTLSPEAPFTWASGLKAPIYCDNRLTMGAFSAPSVTLA